MPYYGPSAGGESRIVLATAAWDGGDFDSIGGAYETLDEALDLVVPAAAGDVVLLEPHGRWRSGGAYGVLNAATYVDGDLANYCWPGSDGPSGWGIGSSAQSNIVGSIPYIVQADDIEDNSVRFVLVAKADGKTLAGSGSEQLTWTALNTGLQGS